MIRRLDIVIAGLAVLLLLGCGGQSQKPLGKAEYGQKLNAYAQQFKASVEGSRGKIQGASDSGGKVAGLGEFRSEFDKLATQLGRLAPPAVAKTAHDALVGTLHKGATDIGQVQDAVRTSDQAKAQSALQALQGDNVQIQSEISDLQSKVSSSSRRRGTP